MGLFSNKKKYEFDMDEELEELSREPAIRSAAPSHMLTPDEILSDFGGSSAEKANNSDSGALERMKQRMLNISSEAAPRQTDSISTAVSPEEHYGNGAPHNNSAPKASEAASAAKEPKVLKTEKPDSAIDFMSLFATEKNRPEKPVKSAESEQPQPNASSHKPKESLLDKCTPYIIDDNGNNASDIDEPLYTLESVADILRSNSNKALEALSRKYDITLDTLGRSPKAEPKASERQPQSETEAPVRLEIEPSPQGGIMIDGEPLIFDDELPQISDIDTNTSKRSIPDAPSTETTATIRFTPVRDSSEDTERLSISSATRPIDITGELTALSSTGELPADDIILEQSEFEAFKPSEEPKSAAEIKKTLMRYSRLRRRAFLQAVFSFIMLLVSALMLLPAFSDMLIRTPQGSMIYSTAVLLVSILINFDMLLSFKTFFSKRASADVPVALSAISALGLGIYAVTVNQNAYGILLSVILIIAVRAFCRFKSISAVFGNMKQVFSRKPQKAVTLITDEATAFAMAKSAVEGDALIAAPRSIEAADDFMRYTEYAPLLGGKICALSVTAIILACIFGFAAAAFFRGAFWGIYTAAVLLSAAACPALLTIEALPLASAAARLNKKGSMIAGCAAANRLELANAAVISSNDIFPEGTVSLKNVKVLSENSFDENILRAASLTEALGSPLAPIFKQIAGTGQGYTIPDSETVKYEDHLGISGWVGDQLIFIGNRTLMQAHGIAVPDIEVDRKILRQGYFPVYLGVENKACALLIISYEVDPQVAYELRRLTNLGVTLLVNSCDPNLTEEMICDYIGLYGDSVKVMNNSGAHMYKNAVIPCSHCSAPAVFRGSSINFISVLNCASRIKRSVRWLSVFYAIAACMGAALFTYISFISSSQPISDIKVLISHCITAFISLIIFLVTKP